jgi:hypothetical protein
VANRPRSQLTNFSDTALSLPETGYDEVLLVTSRKRNLHLAKILKAKRGAD